MRKLRFSYLGKPETADGTPRRICGDMYLPEESVPIRAVVQFVHGMEEHFGRYGAFAQALCSAGIVLAGCDLRGHGRSVGADGVFGSFSAADGGWGLVLSDLFRLRAILRAKFHDVPYFLMGHSMGSFFVRSMLAAEELSDNAPLADGVILSATAYHDAAALQAGRALTRAFIARKGRTAPFTLAVDSSSVLYNLRIRGRKTPLDWISADEDNVRRFHDDPLCGHTPTAGLIDDMLGGLLAVCAGMLADRTRISSSALFLAGKEDPVGDYGIGVRRTAAQFSILHCPSVTTTLYPHVRHEILLDTCREQVYADIIAWIDGILCQRGTGASEADSDE